MRTPSRFLSLTLLALAGPLALGAGSARAAIPDAKGVVHACYAAQTKAVRLSDSGRCNRGETPVSWSVTGPRGPAGGPGPAGPAGVVSFHTVTETTDLVAGFDQEGNLVPTVGGLGLECAPGEAVTGGGYSIEGDPEVVAKVNVFMNQPSVPGDPFPQAWRVRAITSVPEPVLLNVWAICAKLR